MIRLGRRKQYENVSARVRAWRENHKEPKYLTISQTEYSAKLKDFKGICVNQNYDLQKVIEVYPEYVAYFLKHGIDLRKLPDFDYNEKHSKELNNLLDYTVDVLNYGIRVFDFYEFIEWMPNTAKHYYPECNIRFCLLDTACPLCGAVIKIEEVKNYGSI